MVKIVSIKFKDGGKPYYFAPGELQYEKGMGVIVETSKGLEYAVVDSPVKEVDESEVVSPLKPVVRIATPADLEQVKRNEERKDEALQIAKEKIEARGLDMKPVGVEFAFDGTKVTIFFTSENRVDFRELIKDLSSAFRMRIELRQIGIREEIKLMGGLAPCGRECCCVRSLQEPKKVSVKMAKNQGLSLNPSKISGLCGRLMCCLAYENDYYSDACKKVPKIGSEAETPEGKGIVVNVNMLKMTVKVKIEKGDAVSYHDYGVDEISFMRGNVAMGKTGDDDDEEAIEEIAEGKEELIEEKPQPVKENRQEVKAESKVENKTENKAENARFDKNRHNKDRGNKQNSHNGENKNGKPNIANGEHKNNKPNSQNGEHKANKPNGQNNEHKNNKQSNGKNSNANNVNSVKVNFNRQAEKANAEGGVSNGEGAGVPFGRQRNKNRRHHNFKGASKENNRSNDGKGAVSTQSDGKNNG
ncbi:MAG: regulatory iron-sulfur-containing complex subunit RicT [Candidatus Coproplasma sp.]